MNSQHFSRIICTILFLLSFFSLSAQSPICNFGDLDGYFYHWKFSAENIKFKFELQNNTSEDVLKDISNYEISWGDGSTDNVTNNDFPVKHTYNTQGQFDLVITITYLGVQYSYEYIVYNTTPEITLSKYEGNKGCIGQKYIFQVSGYENNPPSTKYQWYFDDNGDNPQWTHEDIKLHDEKISHIYERTSCDSKGDVKHFSVTITPFIEIGEHFLKDLGKGINSIEISHPSKIDLSLKVNNKEEDIEESHHGCVNSTEFEFTNKSDYGLEGYFCRETDNHLWIIYKTTGGVITEEAQLNEDYKFIQGDANSKSNINIVFLKTGTYKILFHLENACNKSEEQTGEISIYDNENTTTYTPDNFCLAEEEVVSFTTKADPEIEAIQKTTYIWNSTPGEYVFVEGTNTNSQNPKIKFTQAGKHLVHLEKTSLCGTEEYDYWIEVSDVPIVRITPLSDLKDNGYCGPYTFTPKATYTDNGKETFGIEDNVIDQYEWTFNNNGTITHSNQKEPAAITFNKIGKSSISLRAHNSKCGWSEVDIIEFEIYEIPTPSFTRSDKSCEDEEVGYEAKPDDMASYLWNFGDGNTSTGQNTNHIFSSVGTYSNRLMVTSDKGCKNSTSRDIEIIKKPVVEAGEDDYICASDASYPPASATVSNSSSITWTSNGDGSFSDPHAIAPTYTLGTTDREKSEIKLTLTASGNAPCGEVSDFLNLHITPPPSINISQPTATICENSVLQIEGVEVFHASSIKWTADKGGTFSSTGITNPLYTPPADFGGKIILSLQAFTNGSCSNIEKQIELTVNKLPVVNAGPDESICEGENIELTGASDGISNKWTSSGDGTFTAPNQLTTLYTPGPKDLSAESVVLTLESKGAAPCGAVTDSKALTIVRKPIAEAGKDVGMCKTENSYTVVAGEKQGQAFAQNASSIKWTSSGSGKFNDPTLLNTTYTPSAADVAYGSVTLTLEASPLNYCSVPATDHMTLSFVNPPQVNAGMDITDCQNNTISLTGISEHSSSVRWTSSGKGIFTDATKLETTYTPADDEIGNTTLTLTAQSLGLCDPVSDELSLTLIAKPQAFAGEDSEICANNSYNLAEGSKGAQAYSAQSVLWKSKGDGHFDDPKAINATYTPGPNDKQNGSVVLELTANPITPCAGTHADEMILTITPLPTANAGEDQAICQGEQFEITGAQATHYTKVEWKTSSASGYFENPNTLAPTYHSGQEDVGKTTLSITVYGKGSCSFVQDEMILNITPAPVVSLADRASICEDGRYIVQGAVAQNTPGYQWSHTGKGFLSNEKSLEPIYEAAKGETGTIDLCLEVQGNGLCVSKKACTTVSIVPHPTVDAGDDDEVCSNQVYEMNVGPEDGQVKANSWSTIEYTTSGDGFFQDQEGLDVKYVPGTADIKNGSVKIKIRANSLNPPCNEHAEDEMLLTITPAPEVKAGDNDQICEGDTYQLLNAREQNTSKLHWTSLNEGTFSNEGILHPIYTPENGKTGMVTLELTGTGKGSCASATDRISLNIIPTPHVDAGKDAIICIGKNYELQSVQASSFSSVLWTTSGTGTFVDNAVLKPTYIPSEEDYKAGSTRLKVQVEGLQPCTLNDEDEIELKFVPAPVISAGEDDQICQETGSYTIRKKTTDYPEGAYVQNISLFKWETNGQGSLQNANTLEPTYIPAKNETGIIKLTLKAAGNYNCDQVEDKMQLTIIPTPTPDFKTGTNCLGDPVLFEDQSSGGLYKIESWHWDFGDGSTSNEQNPNHQFGEAKGYPVSLKITNTESCFAVCKKTINVNPLPVMKFSHEKITALNTPVAFNNECFNAVAFEWNFGDGATSTAITPSHSFSTPGIYEIQLKAQSNEGCYNTLTSEIEVIGEPKAQFKKTEDGCGPLTVNFTNESTGKFVNYLWDFGNGQNSTEENPGAIVYEPGKLNDTTYFVTLTVENMSGSSVFKDLVVVKPQPIPQFEILPSAYGCTPMVRDIFNHSLGKPTDYEFDFGDGSTYAYPAKDIERPFQHLFTTNEVKTIYPVSLVATNECGSRSITKNVTVFPNTAVAVMRVNETEGCAPFTVEFQNLSTGAGDYLESDWVFEEGKVAVRDYKGESMVHTFDEAGVYTVQLTVHDTCATDQTSQKIIVHDAMDIDFEIKARKLCMQEEIEFTVPETIVKQFTNFTWNFGDGSIGKGPNTTHRFLEKGKYLITLSAISLENNCEKNIGKEITIFQKPIANFDLSSQEGCEPFEINFSNTSSFADYFQWDFEDSSKSSDTNPKHFFSKGDYTVTLIAETKAGCLDTTTNQLTSRPKPVAQFEIQQETACSIPFVLNIKNQTENKEDNSYTWDFDNGNSDTSMDPEKVHYSEYGQYNIQLIAENRFLCRDTATKAFNIYRKPIPGYKIINQRNCQGDIFEFSDTSLYRKYTYWKFGDGYTSEGKNASHIFKDYGRYDLFMKVVGEGNCTDSLLAKDTILVYPKPTPVFFWKNVNTPPEGVQIAEGETPPNNGIVKFTNTTNEIEENWIEDTKFTYRWNFDDFAESQEKDPIHKFQANGNFHVKLVAETAYSCKDSVTETVEVDFMSALFVPNAFHPGNPNPQVAVFLPKGIGLYKYQISILDNWGKVVWESDKIKNGHPAEAWNGTSNGKPLPKGVYVWKIRAIFKNGTTWQGMKIGGKFHREGTVTLIR
ncbi:MAG: PKD domain-containing protein [Marinifilaceae bacterium]